MKKTLIISCIALAVALFAFKNRTGGAPDTKNNSKGIHFHTGSWQAALDQAKSENKLIFLDVYASWCGPCKKLKSNTFSNQTVGSYFNKRFINMSLDAEKGEGLVIAKNYRVNQYPTLLFINGEGQVVKQTAGYHNPEQLVKLGQSVK